MKRKIIAPKDLQPESFQFSADNRAWTQEVIAKYPSGRQASAVMPLLDRAQRQNDGWLPLAAIEHVAEILTMPYIRVLEVATFYSMYNLEPVGTHFVQVCTTTPCWLRGAGEVVTACQDALKIKIGETTPDGEFTLVEVECLGACVNAPMMQINDEYYEDLDAGSTVAILQALSAGKTPRTGPQIDRHTSAPAAGLTSLLENTEAADAP